jgi:hypothetical protein
LSVTIRYAFGDEIIYGRGTYQRHRRRYRRLNRPQNCLVGDFDLCDGVAKNRVTRLDTKVLRLTGKGEVDLARDTIDYYVAPSAKTRS